MQNKCIVVTGGATGIGAAAVRALAAKQAQVILADYQQEPAERLREELAEQGHTLHFIQTDVSSPEAVQELFKRVHADFGRLDGAFNNAGTEGQPILTHEMTLEQWKRVIDTNLTGMWLCMKEEILLMRQYGVGGSIVNTSSFLGMKGWLNMGHYTASKHGIIGLTRAAALENVQERIRINAIAPGVIDTPMVQRFTGGDADARAFLATVNPMQRLGTSEEVASSVVWLLSDESQFVTGSVLSVDGGISAQ